MPLLLIPERAREHVDVEVVSVEPAERHLVQPRVQIEVLVLRGLVRQRIGDIRVRAPRELGDLHQARPAAHPFSERGGREVGVPVRARAGGAWGLAGQSRARFLLLAHAHERVDEAVKRDDPDQPVALIRAAEEHGDGDAGVVVDLQEGRVLAPAKGGVHVGVSVAESPARCTLFLRAPPLPPAPTKANASGPASLPREEGT